MLYFIFLQQSVEEKAFLSFVLLMRMKGPRDKKKTTSVQLCDTCVRFCNSAELCKIYPDEERMFNNPSARLQKAALTFAASQQSNVHLVPNATSIWV